MNNLKPSFSGITDKLFRMVHEVVFPNGDFLSECLASNEGRIFLRLGDFVYGELQSNGFIIVRDTKYGVSIVSIIQDGPSLRDEIQRCVDLWCVKNPKAILMEFLPEAMVDTIEEKLISTVSDEEIVWYDYPK